MADTKISALTEATTVAAADETVIVQSGSTKRVGIDTIFSTANAAWSGWVYPYTTGWVGTAGAPLTSTSWDGDAHSTESKTKIDLSAVFGCPASIKAVLATVSCRDSGSAGTAGLFVILSPNNTASSGSLACRPSGLTNDYVKTDAGVVPCDASGDLYYQLVASGASTLDVWIEIWGYCL
jgi:hypothetical protein